MPSNGEVVPGSDPCVSGYAPTLPAVDGVYTLHVVPTDSAGNATFTGSITIASVAAAIDNEVILHGEVPSRHQYIRQLFAPCAES